jgi:hypothetical protein
MDAVSEHIVNPRRAPRAPARCSAQVEAPDASWATETEDIGPSGCQLVAPRAMARGLPLGLVITNPRMPGSLKAVGMVAWCSPQAPWRVGVAFADSSREPAERWFNQLVATFPGLGNQRRVPERLPTDAMLYLSAPPSLVDFTPEEVGVLRHVASGITVAELRSRLARDWRGSQRAIFSLMARGVLTLSRAGSAHPAAWKRVMAELGAEFVTEPSRARPAPFTEAVGLETPPDVAGRVDLDPGLDVSPALELAEPPGKSPAQPPARPPPLPAHPPPLPTRAAPPAPGVSSAGTGWRGVVRNRPRDAQECFDLGKGELEAGRASSALAHLRRALQLAPGDAEIAGWIGRALKGPPPKSS